MESGNWELALASDAPESSNQRGRTKNERQSGQSNKGKLTVRGHWAKLQTWASYLTELNRLQASRYPQLGNFLNVDVTGKFKGMMYHQIWVRFLKTNNKNLYEFWFLINEKPVRFSAIEFALVSGLRFRCKLTDSERAKMERSTLKSRYFSDKGENMVSIADVENQLALLQEQNVETTNRLKLVFVLIASGVLLPARNGLIEDKTFKVCDDLDICEKYDWGQQCWYKSYYNIVNKVDKHVHSAGGQLENWESPGCPWFQMYWMLEAIQGMDNAIHSVCIENSSNVYPRMLRWKLGCKSPNNDASAKFLNKVKVVIPQLKPDRLEREMSYMKKLAKFMKDNFEDVLYADLRNAVKNKELHYRVDEHENVAEPANMDNAHPSTSHIPSTSNVEDMPPWAVQLDQRFQTLEEKQMVEAQLAMQWRREYDQRFREFEDKQAAEIQLARQWRQSVDDRLGAQAQLSAQRHSQIMQAIQQSATADREYEMTSPNFGQAVDLEVAEEVEDNRLRNLLHRSPYQLRAKNKKRLTRATTNILP